MDQLAGNTPLNGIDAVALDTETTGLDPRTARVVQIAAVGIGIDAGRVPFDALVNPEVPVPPASSAIHGLRDGDLEGAPGFADLAPALDDYCAGRLVVGHSIDFDLAILAAENERINRDWVPYRTLDTSVLARAVLPGLGDYTIESIAGRLGVAVRGRHTAFGDAATTAALFTALLPLLQDRGIRTLGEAERASRQVFDRMPAGSPPGAVPGTRWRQVPSPVRPPAARIDSFAYSHLVGDVMSAEPLIVDGQLSIAEAAHVLTARGTSSAFVGLPPPEADTGIVTERDLMRALADPARGGAEPVASIASRPLISVPSDAFVYRALALMDRHRIRHLAVVSPSGTLLGALTTGDLLRQRAQAALFMGDEIEQASDVRDLARAWSRLATVVRSMLGEATPTPRITSVISEELAALTRRAGEIAARDMRASGLGAAPVPYALLILGSGGRGESRLAPDQDNALIYAGTQDDDRLDAWFAEFGRRVAGLLDEAGVPLCKGGVMAKNPAWRHSLGGWKRVVSGWIDGFKNSSLLSVDIFFDFRPVLGDTALADSLRAGAFDRARSSRGFLKSLAALTTDVRSPIGLFGTIRTEDGRVDCKKNGLFAIVGGARALAIREGVAARSTVERLEAVRARGVINKSDSDDLIDAHEVLSREILRQQLADIEAGIPASSRVALDRLTRRERAELKWALGRVEVAQLIVAGPGGLG